MKCNILTVNSFTPCASTNVCASQFLTMEDEYALTLKAPSKKNASEMSSAEVDELSIEANSADPEQTAPTGAV